MNPAIYSILLEIAHTPEEIRLDLAAEDVERIAKKRLRARWKA